MSLAVGRGALKEMGYRYDPKLRLWMIGRRPAHPRHRAELASMFATWVEAGHMPDTFVIEPRLPYRSPAGGERHLDPDGLLISSGTIWALEVDRGSEGRKDLVHKWWRYREFGEEVTALPLVVVAPPSRHALIRETLAGAGVWARISRTLPVGILSEDLTKTDGDEKEAGQAGRSAPDPGGLSSEDLAEGEEDHAEGGGEGGHRKNLQAEQARPEPSSPGIDPKGQGEEEDVPETEAVGFTPGRTEKAQAHAVPENHSEPQSDEHRGGKGMIDRRRKKTFDSPSRQTEGERAESAHEGDK